MNRQSTWQRILLLAVLGYEGLGAVLGGSLLAARPDGRYMDMPVSLMHGTFRDFLIPGVILFGLGVLSLAAFVGVLRKSRADWILASLAIGGLAVWFFVEIVIIRELHWLHVMWGFPVILGGVVAVPLLPFRPDTMRIVWLVCGILSSIFYLAINLIVASRWPGYDPASLTVSELSAVGAPTRPLWVILAMIYTVLVIGFGWGVWMAGAESRRLRVAGALIAIYGALGLVWPLAPMHQRPVLAAGGGTFSDTLHLVLAGVTVLIYLLALGFAATALGRAFRVYSIATFIALAGFGALTFRLAPLVDTNQPTPLLGVWERLNIGVFLIWVIVLAVVLLARQRTHARRASLPAPERKRRMVALTTSGLHTPVR